MATSNEPLVPHVFPTSGGENISPNQVNENAWALYDAAVRLMTKRYNYFPVVLDPEYIDQADGAAEGQWVLQAPFGWEVMSAELIVYGDTSVSGSESITLTCSATPWNTLTATADHDNPTTQGRDFQPQTLQVDADEAITFSLSVPTVSSATVPMYAIVYCRHDAVAEAGITLTLPPQVKDGDTYDATEWNAWFSAFNTDLGNLKAALSRRRRFDVQDLGRDDALVIAVTDTGAFMAMPGRQNDLVEEARLYVLMAATGTITATAYDLGIGQVIWDEALAATGATTWAASGSITLTNAVVDNSRSSVSCDLDISSSGFGTLLRCYTITCWQENA